MKFVETRCYVWELGYVHNESSRGILDTLQFGNLHIWCSPYKTITIVESRGNKGMHSYTQTIQRQVFLNSSDIMYMKECTAACLFHMCRHGRYFIKPDS